MILCCNCGIEIEPNHKNMCVRCIHNMSDLTSKIKTNMSVETCRGCQRYHMPPGIWKILAWGSKDLLIFLLNRNHTLKKLNITDSNFIYTEETSKKIKVQINVCEDGVEQQCNLNYSVRNMQCPDCQRTEAQQFWRALVQVRQKPAHKRAFLYLEQLILNHKAHLKTSNIKDRKEGIDFYFLDRADAVRLVDFISGYIGTKTIDSSRLISEDLNNNFANKKFTFSVELSPFWKDDFIWIDNKSLGLGNFALVTKVRNMIYLTDPQTGKTNKLMNRDYFANPSKYKILFRSKDFKMFTVVMTKSLGNGLYEITVTDENMNVFEVNSVLNVREDDVVLGYKLHDSSLNVDNEMVADIVLVRLYKDKEREWKIQTSKPLDSEYNLFLDDIAEDKDMVKYLSIFDHKNELIENFENLNL